MGREFGIYGRLKIPTNGNVDAKKDIGFLAALLIFPGASLLAVKTTGLREVLVVLILLLIYFSTWHFSAYLVFYLSMNILRFALFDFP